MTNQENLTAHRLMKAFMQFKKADWHHSTFKGYKSSEIRLLFCIKNGLTQDAEEMKVSEISKLLRVTPPTVTQLITGLEAKGLVERNMDQVDRRAVRISLAPKGENITRQAGEVFLSTFNGLVEYLGEEDSNHLSRLMSKVILYFNEIHSIPDPDREGR